MSQWLIPLKSVNAVTLMAQNYILQLHIILIKHCNTDHKYKFPHVGPGKIIQELPDSSHILKKIKFKKSDHHYIEIHSV